MRDPSIAIGYVRRDNSGVQLRQIGQYCAKHSLMPARIFYDDELAQALTTMADNGGEHCQVPSKLIVSSLDRLGRNMHTLYELVETAKAQGWSVVAIDSDFDSSTADGQMFFAMLTELHIQAQAEARAHLTSERVRRWLRGRMN